MVWLRDTTLYRAFIAFAGGGAKGLIHVGALRALEDRNVEVCGLAGTSAGAIVAALKAAGFSSDELLDPDAGLTLLDKLHEIDCRIKNATDIFGDTGWVRVRFFRWAASHLPLFGSFAGAVGVGAISVLIWAGTTQSCWAIALTVILVLSIILLGLQGALILLGGLADLSRFRSALGVLLQRKMFPDDPGRTVTMGDFAQNQRPTLKIVSANLSNRRLHLFSPERTPEVPVADAVAASICLPLIFEPWKVGGSVFVDGGIVSNLPAWPFDEERELDPSALTIAIEIADTSNVPVIRKFNWLPSAIRTALFGSGELNLRVSGQAEQLVLESRLNLLQFDLTLEQARQEVRDARAAAIVRLDRRLFRRPELYRDACEVTRGLAEDVIESALGIQGKRVRVAIAVPDRDYYYSLRLRFSSGYETDPDEHMLVPINGSVLGAAWQAEESRFELAPFPDEFDLPGEQNRLRRKLRWSELAWQLCIPIFDTEDRLRLAVHIGGNAALQDDPQLEDAITELESSVKDFFSLIIKELFDLEDGYGLEERRS